MDFKGSGFSLQLPDGTVDASSYAFAFPHSEGQYTPTLTVKCEICHADTDLGSIVDEHERALLETVPDGEALSRSRHRTVGREYIVSVVGWGPQSMQMRQKFVYLLIEEAVTRLYTMIYTNTSEGFAVFEPTIDAIIRSFQATNEQLISANVARPTPFVK
ncbi:MAG: hypothetical protein PVG76_10750 [Chromatiales bacterium]